MSGGNDNAASGEAATVGGGILNTASGASATVAGGFRNSAAGNYSFAAGYHAKANHNGTFIWSDNRPFDFASGGANTFKARATGGVRFVVGIDGTGATTWSCAVFNGNGGWTCTSDRNQKENFENVDGRDILARLSRIPILKWNAKGADPTVKHLGPMAQDFYAAFGLGDDDKSISTIDLDGVALASIQSLYEIIQEKDAQLASLNSQVTRQQTQIDALQTRLAALEQGGHLLPPID